MDIDTFPLAPEHEWLRAIAKTTDRSDMLDMVTFAGRCWLVASDNSLAIAITLHASDSTPCERHLLLSILDKNFVTGTDQLDLNALRAFLSPLIQLVAICKTCKGTGRVVCRRCFGKKSITCTCQSCENEHSSDCNKCSDGKQECDACLLSRPIRFVLRERVFSVSLWLSFLQHVSWGVARIYQAESKSSPLFLDGGDWRVVIMPMLGNGDGLPRFDLE